MIYKFIYEVVTNSGIGIHSRDDCNIKKTTFQEKVVSRKLSLYTYLTGV